MKVCKYTAKEKGIISIDLNSRELQWYVLCRHNYITNFVHLSCNLYSHGKHPLHMSLILWYRTHCCKQVMGLQCCFHNDARAGREEPVQLVRPWPDQ